MSPSQKAGGPLATSASERVIGISNLPNQRHKIASRNGTKYTLMVVGESGLGKSTFINTLFTSTLKDYKNQTKRHAKQVQRTVNIDIARALIEEKNFPVQLTVIDTPGFGDYVNNTHCWVPIVDFLDEQFASYMKSEQKPNRHHPAITSTGGGGLNGDHQLDLRVHACLYFIPPTGHSLRAVDIEVMKQLGQRVNLIPIIAKADTLTPKDMAAFKNRVRECIRAHNIHVYVPPVESDDEDNVKRNTAIVSAMPYSVIGSETDVLNAKGQKVKGRQYTWGNSEVENESHCDFTKLRNLLIRTHMLDLITTTEDIHYESYRSRFLASEGRNDDDPSLAAKKKLEQQVKVDEAALRTRFTEQVRIEANRFRQWEQRLISERDRLNKDLEMQHKSVKAVEDELEDILQRRK